MTIPQSRALPYVSPSAILCVVLLCHSVPLAQAQSSAGKGGTLQGQVGVAKSDGTVLVPQPAQVYVIYTKGLHDDRFSAASYYGSATAGGQFNVQRDKALGSVKKELKNIEKSNLPGERADKIAEYYLRSVDTALAAVSDWVTKNPAKNWQAHKLMPDAGGLWSIDNLEPGSYEIIGRGTIAGNDNEWEAYVDLSAGQTISLPLTRPRYINHHP